MNLYLIRHAIAAPRNAPGVLDDADRELTPAGIRKMRRQAAALAEIARDISEIWSSPLVRAKQTADILAEALGLAVPPRIVRALAPEGRFADLLERLAKRRNAAGIAIVGHEPYLSEFAGFLVCGTRSAGFELRKGGAARIEIADFSEPVRGCLRWLLTPKLLRAMG